MADSARHATITRAYYWPHAVRLGERAEGLVDGHVPDEGHEEQRAERGPGAGRIQVADVAEHDWKSSRESGAPGTAPRPATRCTLATASASAPERR